MTPEKHLGKKYIEKFKLPKTITDLETAHLSDAYSALKDLHAKMRADRNWIKEENKKLRRELEDYKNRYDHLIKYLNSISK